MRGRMESSPAPANGQVAKRQKQTNNKAKNNNRNSMPARPSDLKESSIRASGFKLWTVADRSGAVSRVPTNAHIKNTARLMVPESWSQLETIRDIVIEDEDDVFKVFPTELSHIRGLKSLKFSWSQCKTLPDYMATIPLRYMSMRENRLQNVDTMVHMMRLVYVDLSNNRLDHLPRDIGRLPELSILNVSGNKLKELPQSVGQLGKLQELNCSSNRLRDLPSSIGQLRQLTNLDMSFNLLQGLPDSMGGLVSLTELRVTNNQLKDLPSGLAGATHLRHLFLAGNQFSHVPPALTHLPYLQSVNFRQNFIESMNHRLVATTLLLDQNNFKEIPDVLCDCQNLETLSLQFNEIKVVNPAIGRLRALRILYLGGNEFTEVPDELCQLANLRHLSLNSTDIETLPTMFDTLRSLNFLDLSGTKMEPALQDAYRSGVEGVMKYVKKAREIGTARPVSTARPGSAKDKPNRQGSAKEKPTRQGSAKDNKQSLKRQSTKLPPAHTPEVYTEETQNGGAVQ